MPDFNDDRVSFHIVRENGAATWGYRHVWFEGQDHVTSFDLTENAARVTFVSSMLGYGQELLLDVTEDFLGTAPRPPGVHVGQVAET